MSLCKYCVTGPVDIVRDVIAFTGAASANLIGYDWGAGIALSTALVAPKSVNKIVIHNATYTEQGTELTHLKHSTLILWTKGGDPFHPIAWANKFKQRIKSSKLVLLPPRADADAAVVTEAIKLLAPAVTSA